MEWGVSTPLTVTGPCDHFNNRIQGKWLSRNVSTMKPPCCEKPKPCGKTLEDVILYRVREAKEHQGTTQVHREAIWEVGSPVPAPQLVPCRAEVHFSQDFLTHKVVNNINGCLGVGVVSHWFPLCLNWFIRKMAMVTLSLFHRVSFWGVVRSNWDNVCESPFIG